MSVMIYNFYIKKKLTWYNDIKKRQVIAKLAEVNGNLD